MLWGRLCEIESRAKKQKSGPKQLFAVRRNHAKRFLPQENESTQRKLFHWLCIENSLLRGCRLLHWRHRQIYKELARRCQRYATWHLSGAPGVLLRYAIHQDGSDIMQYMPEA